MKNTSSETTAEKRDNNISNVIEHICSDYKNMAAKKGYDLFKVSFQQMKYTDENIKGELILWIEDIKKFRIARDFAFFNFKESFPENYTVQINGNESETYKLIIADINYSKPKKEKQESSNL